MTRLKHDSARWSAAASPGDAFDKGFSELLANARAFARSDSEHRLLTANQLRSELVQWRAEHGQERVRQFADALGATSAVADELMATLESEPCQHITLLRCVPPIRTPASVVSAWSHAPSSAPDFRLAMDEN